MFCAKVGLFSADMGLFGVGVGFYWGCFRWHKDGIQFDSWLTWELGLAVFGMSVWAGAGRGWLD